MNSESNIGIKKIGLYPVGDKIEVARAYQYIHDAMYAQNKAYNILMSNVYSCIYRGMADEELYDIYKRGARKPREKDPTYSLYSSDLKFPSGLPITANVSYTVKKDIRTAQSRGLFKGKCVLPTRRLDASLIVNKKYLTFYHEYGSDEEMKKHIKDKDFTVYMKFTQKIVFRVIFGSPARAQKLYDFIGNILDGTFEVMDSSIQFDSSGNKIMLNLTFSSPKRKAELDENTVLGVAIGFAVPAACAVNNSRKTMIIGSRQEFLNARLHLQARRREIQSSTRYAKGGHGRKRKTEAVVALNRKEKNIQKNYNHNLSKKIIDYAVAQHAKYINIEDPTNYPKDIFIMRNWSLFELMRDIEYKAEYYGIKVNRVETKTHLPEVYVEESAKEDAISLAKAIAAMPVEDKK